MPNTHTDHTYLKGKPLEICSFLSKPKQDAFLSILLRIANDYGNTIRSCPIRRGFFNVTGVQVHSSYFPSFTPVGKYVLLVNFTKPTMEGKNDRVQFALYKWEGSVYRNWRYYNKWNENRFNIF